MKRTFVPVLILAIVIVGILSLVFFPDPKPRQRPIPETTSNIPIDNVIAVKDYVQMNISSLSSVKATMGGTFYLTSIEVYAKSGVVFYEDGHNAYTADFTYSVDKAGQPSIITFKIRS